MNDHTVEEAINNYASTKAMLATDASNILKVLDPFTAFADEILATAEGNSLRLSAIDPAHVAMIKADLDIGDVPGPYSHWETFKANVPVDRLVGPLKSFGNELVAMSVFDDRIEIVNDRAMRMARTVGGDPITLRIPEINCAAETTLDSDGIARILGITKIRDYIDISCDRTAFIVSTASDTESATLRFPGQFDASYHSALPADYVVSILTHIKPGKGVVAVSFDTDYPVSFRWQVGGVKFEVIVAPRVEAER